MENTNREERIGRKVGKLLAKFIVWLISAGLIMWGWNTVAPHLNCPQFSFTEIFAMRMGLSQVMAIIWQKK